MVVSGIGLLYEVRVDLVWMFAGSVLMILVTAVLPGAFRCIGSGCCFGCCRFRVRPGRAETDVSARPGRLCYTKIMKKIWIIALVIISLVAAVWFLVPYDYYEYDAASADECLPGELYDEEYQVCYFDFYCETDAACAELDLRYGQILDALADEYADSEHEHLTYGEKPVSTDVVSPVTQPEVGAVNDVSSAKPAKTETQAIVDGNRVAEIVPTPPQVRPPQTIEEIMAALLPANDLARIVEYKKESDGPDGILAYVTPANETGSEWILGYDPADSFTSAGKLNNPRQLMATLIHEYAHVLSLNNTQVEHVSRDAEYIECDVTEIIVDEGCAKASSYLAQFITAYWDEATREKAYRALLNRDEEDFAYELYTEQPNNFVTEYAATNAGEDFAESFALFVMRDRNANPSTVAEQKIAFFYQYPELVTLRTHMRGGLVRVLRE